MTQSSSPYPSDTIGGAGDAVTLQLGSDTLMVAESWNVHEGVLEQPATWSIRCGWGGTAAQFLAKYPKGTPFSLFVGGIRQQSGRLDGRRCTNSGGATEVVLKGRDMLARVYDSYVDANQSFTDTTYTTLVWRVLLYLNLVTGTNPDPAQLQTSNQANRQVKAGKPITQLQPPRTVDQILTDADGAPVTATQSMAIQANVGERWLHFLRRYLDPAGLILWAAADGTFVLSAPNVNQAPLYQIVRQGVAGGSGNVVGYEFDDDATHQHSVAVCYGRGGGRVAGRTKVKQGEVNDDLFNDPSGWYRGPDAGGDGYAQPIAFREHNVQNSAQASNFALRKLAEERREGYQLIYTVAGHTLPCFGGNGSAVITPDTVVAVNDVELGIVGNFYLESLERARSPQTTTRIRLMRPGDIVLEPDFSQ